MPDIKMRTVAEKTVKTIDKSAIAAQRMKTAYVQRKEKTERSVHTAGESPEGYAADCISDSVTNAIHEGARQFDSQGLSADSANCQNYHEKSGENVHEGNTGNHSCNQGFDCRYLCGELDRCRDDGPDLHNWSDCQLSLWDFLFWGGQWHRPDHA